jgi:Yip1-like protein
MRLVDRAKNILLTPSTEWAAIDAETTSVKDLYVGYAVVLAAIGPIAAIIGFGLIGLHVPFTGVTYRWPLDTALERAVVQYLLSLGGAFVLALIIDGLAPTFGGQKNQLQALKVSIYASTASWLAGIFVIIPALAILGLLGLYSLYLLYAGLPILMKAPKDKAMGYTVVTIICAIVLYFVLAIIAGAVVSVPRYM